MDSGGGEEAVCDLQGWSLGPFTVIALTNSRSPESETGSRSGLSTLAVGSGRCSTSDADRFSFTLEPSPLWETSESGVTNVFHDLGENSMQIFLNSS